MDATGSRRALGVRHLQPPHPRAIATIATHVMQRNAGIMATRHTTAETVQANQPQVS